MNAKSINIHLLILFLSLSIIFILSEYLKFYIDKQIVTAPNFSFIGTFKYYYLNQIIIYLLFCVVLFFLINKRMRWMVIPFFNILILHLFFFTILIEFSLDLLYHRDFMAGLNSSLYRFVPFVNQYIIPFIICVLIYKNKFSLRNTFLLYVIIVLAFHIVLQCLWYYEKYTFRYDRLGNLFKLKNYSIISHYHEMKYIYLQQLAILLLDFVVYKLLFRYKMIAKHEIDKQNLMNSIP